MSYEVNEQTLIFLSDNVEHIQDALEQAKIVHTSDGFCPLIPHNHCRNSDTRVTLQHTMMRDLMHRAAGVRELDDAAHVRGVILRNQALEAARQAAGRVGGYLRGLKAQHPDHHSPDVVKLESTLERFKNSHVSDRHVTRDDKPEKLDAVSYFRDAVIVHQNYINAINKLDMQHQLVQVGQPHVSLF